MKRITVKEIAKMAGVSVTAVSFVINNKPGVSDKTRKKVNEIIERTDFKPNLNSKKLLFNKSFNICLLTNPYSSPFDDLFYFEITKGILSQSHKYGYNIVISKPVMPEGELPDIVYSGDTDGMIFMQDISHNLIEKAVASRVPFVIVDSHNTSENATSINPDYCDAAYNATTFLINNGHKKIAMLASETVPDFFSQTKIGFHKALSDNNLPVLHEFSDITAKNEDTAFEAAKRIILSKNRPTAILCTVDSFAIGALHCVKEYGLSVPNDISIMGIDDILLSRYVEPKLTTVGIDKEQMGVLAMDLLQKKIKGEKTESILLPMNIIIRESVKNIR